MTSEYQRPTVDLSLVKLLSIILAPCLSLLAIVQFAGAQEQALGSPSAKPTLQDPQPARPVKPLSPPVSQLAAPGQQETVAGWFDIVWGDGQPGSGRTELLYTITADDGQVTRLLPGVNFEWPAGGPLELNGQRVVLQAQLLEVPDAQGGVSDLLIAQSIQEVTPEPLASVSGSQPWISVLCKFSDVSAEPEALSYFQNMYSSTAPRLDHYWREVSYDNINVLGSDGVGWYTLPQPRSYYVYDMDSDGEDEANLNRLFDDCVAVADSDVNYPSFVGINLMFNDLLDCCAWGGSRTRTLDGINKQWRVTWNPPWSFGNITVMSHEMGHGFGLPHSSGEYGQTYDNAWDVMSNAWYNCGAGDPTYGCLGQHTISYHKDDLGWIPPAEKLIATSGYVTTTLEQLALPQTGNQKMVQIPVYGSTNHFYTLEVRRQVGYDAKLPGQAVIIHEVDQSRNIPAHVIDVDGDGDTGDAGAMFTPGETLTTTHGITVTILSSTATGFVVGVDIAPIPAFDCSIQSEIPLLECQALVALYSNTDGDSWLDNSGWLDSNSPCSWFGVSCSAGRVSTLDLYANQLDGSIPAQLGNLTNIWLLDLAYNQLSGSIPGEIGNLVNLLWLGLYNNQLSGPIPAQMGNLTSLLYLYLDSNQLDGPIPTELGNLTGLIYFYLYNNQLDGPFPAEFGNLVNLQHFHLFNNALLGDVPSSVTNLTSLIGTGIGYNGLSASDPAVISFLNGVDSDWAATQTMPPNNVSLSGVTSSTVSLTWTAIPYNWDGGYYEVGYATISGGPYTVHGATANKSATGYTVDNLDPGTGYYFAVRSHTPAHGSQQNDIWSLYGQEVMTTTLAGPQITHQPLIAAKAGLSLSITATVTSQAPPPAVTLYYSSTGDVGYTGLPMSKATGDIYSATLPAGAVLTPTLSYYLQAVDANAATVDGPHQVAVLEAPPAPLPLSPSGVISDTRPAYSWQEVATAADYQLYLTDADGQFVYAEWVSAAAVCTAGICNHTPAPVLDQADYKWNVRANNVAGNSPWSPAKTFTVFTGSAAPGPATLLAPNSTIADTTPTFSWQEVTDAIRYRVYLLDGDRLFAHGTTVQARNACIAGTCSYNMPTPLVDGDYRWFIRAENPLGGTWSAPMLFTVFTGSTAPGPATLVAPNGTISDSTPTYQWNEVLEAIKYKVYLIDDDRQFVYGTIVQAQNACIAGTCSHTAPAPLPDGDYRWFIQAINPLGATWSAPMLFTLFTGSAAPGQATPVAPNGTITDSTPTYEWQAASDAIQYQVYLLDGSSQFVYGIFVQARNACSGANCSLTPGMVLPNDDYTWWVQSINPLGFSWSAPVDYTLTP